MREHSGRAEGRNNNSNLTLRDAERAKGRSGEAIRGEKRKRTPASRQATAKHS